MRLQQRYGILRRQHLCSGAARGAHRTQRIRILVGDAARHRGEKASFAPRQQAPAKARGASAGGAQRYSGRTDALARVLWPTETVRNPRNSATSSTRPPSCGRHARASVDAQRRRWRAVLQADAARRPQWTCASWESCWCGAGATRPLAGLHASVRRRGRHQRRRSERHSNRGAAILLARGHPSRV